MAYLNINAYIHFYINSLETELLHFSQAHRQFKKLIFKVSFSSYNSANFFECWFNVVLYSISKKLREG